MLLTFYDLDGKYGFYKNDINKRVERIMKLKEKYFNFTEDMVEDLGNFLELYYYKILRVNLTTDTYEIILLRSKEEDTNNKSLTGWMREFAENGGVDPKDKEPDRKLTIKDSVHRIPGLTKGIIRKRLRRLKKQ